jgi:hypothetical protein
LPSEDAFKAVVVAPRSYYCLVCAERQRRQPCPFFHEPSQQFTTDVLRIGGRPAISKHEKLVARFESVTKDVNGLFDLRRIFRNTKTLKAPGGF